MSTGGPAAATCCSSSARARRALEMVGAVVAGIGVVIELAALAARDRLRGRRIHATGPLD